MRGHFINIIEYVPLRGGSLIQLPEELRNSKKGLINLQNVDDKCLMWCYQRHLYPRKVHPERITLEDRELAKEIDISGITWPITRNQLSRFEKQNNVNIFVYGYSTEYKAPYLIYPNKYPKEPYNDKMYVLYIEEGDNTHYLLIKDLCKLVYNHTKHKDKKFICEACLEIKYSQESLERHMVDCIEINGMQATRMPEMYKDKNGVERPPCIYFKNHQFGLQVSFYIVADIEAITEKISSCTPSEAKSYTLKYQKHTACSSRL